MYVTNDSSGNPKQTVTMRVSNTTTVDVNATLYVPGYGVLATYLFKAQTQPGGKSSVGTYVKTVQGPAAVASWRWAGTVYLMSDGPPGALEAWADTAEVDNGPTNRYFAFPR